jgi:hypothetical protein
MTTTYVFLDTNILFRFVTQGQPGCEMGHWEELNALVESSAVTLLVPEVVLLELEKLMRDLEKSLDLEFTKIEKSFTSSLEKEKVWNELRDLVPFLMKQFGEWKRMKVEEAKGRGEKAQCLLNSEHVRRLVFENDVWFRAKRRMLAGRVANPDGRPEADCCIIESMIKFFERKGESNQLLLCTENLKDFGIKLSDGKNAIHPLLKDGLPLTEVFTDLASLVAFIKDRRNVEEPAPDQVKEALEREKAEEVEQAIGLQEAVEQAMGEPSKPSPRPSAFPHGMGLMSLLAKIDPSLLRPVPDLSRYANTVQELAKGVRSMPDLYQLSAAQRLAESMKSMPDLYQLSAA